MPVNNSSVQRCSTIIILGINICPINKQYFDDVKIAMIDC
jgi:hypothetical protein